MSTLARLDHLVVAAPDLPSGVAWCENTLGVTPGPGGEHPLMGTHNRLLRLDCGFAPQAYLEIIAINRAAAPQRAAGQRRWFDLDDPNLQARLATHGPQLVHWVAQVGNATASAAALDALGLKRGEVIAASRPTPSGLLRWRITVRDDGQRLFDGGLPTLIEWGDTHPSDTMAPSGLRLRALTVRHPEATTLQHAWADLGVQGVELGTGSPTLVAELDTPLGPVGLQSH